MAQKKTALIVGVLIALFVLVGVTFTLNNPAQESTDTTETQTAEAVDEREVSADELTQKETLPLPVDLAVALRERVLGNPDAPVKVSEHSSFSCGHCAKFHEQTFKDFKTNWIDTGKAYLVFSDFPLNAPALHASLATRCITDDEQYFAAVEELFAKQKEWAFQSDYFTPLKAIISKYGVDGEAFKACVRSEELQEKLLGKIRATQQQFSVNSTPSFVVNNAVTIAGGTSYEAFNKTLEAAIAESNNPAAGTEEGSP